MTTFQKLLIRGRKYYRTNKRIRAKMLKVLMRAYYHCDIPFEAKLDDTVYFCHAGFGTVIHPSVEIGSETVIQHRVTIGERGGGVPHIGKKCFIGAGAIIIGPIVIGDYARIGAGAVVINDVHSGDTVVGVPASLKRKENDYE